MNKIVKRGVYISLIYLVAVLCTFLITNRVQELDSNSSYSNMNSSLSINFTR